MELLIKIDLCCSKLFLLKVDAKSQLCFELAKASKKRCNLKANDIIKWENEAKYLAVHACSSPQLSCNTEKNKRKFNSSANSILGQLSGQKTL